MAAESSAGRWGLSSLIANAASATAKHAREPGQRLAAAAVQVARAVYALVSCRGYFSHAAKARQRPKHAFRVIAVQANPFPVLPGKRTRARPDPVRDAQPPEIA